MAEQNIVHKAIARLELDAPPEEDVTVREVLENAPLHSKRRVQNLYTHPDFPEIALPDEIDVHCDHAKCEGIRRHAKSGFGKYEFGPMFTFHLVSYACSNCTKSVRLFVLKSWRQPLSKFSGVCEKIYQEPPFGCPIPKRLFEIIGEENREHFLQARRAIARGLGVGAYAYYRRIVENTKFELVGSVLKVAQATKALPEQIELLRRAQTETQFSKAIDMLRGVSAIPPALLIEGHNPLALLHDALSEGIHKLDDADCLQRAQDAEIVLCEIAEKMRLALAEHQSVRDALTNITKRRAVAKGEAPNASTT